MPEIANTVGVVSTNLSVNPVYQDVMVQVPRRLSVKSFADQFYDGKINGVYKLIFNAEQTGFNRCIRRVGKKVWIDVAEYFRWQDEINGTTQTGRGK